MRVPAFRDAKFWVLVAALALVLAALFLPKVERARSVFDLVAVVDITGSMNVRDMLVRGRPATRLEASGITLKSRSSGFSCSPFARQNLRSPDERRPKRSRSVATIASFTFAFW